MVLTSGDIEADRNGDPQAERRIMQAYGESREYAASLENADRANSVPIHYRQFLVDRAFGAETVVSNGFSTNFAASSCHSVSFLVAACAKQTLCFIAMSFAIPEAVQPAAEDDA